MILRITASAFNDRGPLYMEQTLAAVQQGMRVEDRLTLILGRDGPSVGLACEVSPGLRSLLTSQILAHYPSALVERQVAKESSLPCWSVELALFPEIFPLKRHPQFVDPTTRSAADPLAGILHALAGTEQDPLRPRVALSVRPARRNRVLRAQTILQQLQRPRLASDTKLRDRYLRRALSQHGWQRLWAWHMTLGAGKLLTHARDTATTRTHDRETAWQAAHDKLHRRLFEVRLQLTVSAPADQESRALAKLHELVGALATFAEPEHAQWQLRSLQRGPQPVSAKQTFLLSAEELATLWHLPLLSLQVPTLERTVYRQLEPPLGLPDPRREQGSVTLGRVQFRTQHRICGLRADDRRRHLHVVGKTGMGKSTLLLNMLADDIAAGRGCCLIDPHGDLAESLLTHIPARRTNDVIYFDAGDEHHPLAFNPLSDGSSQSRALVCSGILTAFKRIWGDFFGPRMEHIFRHCLLALLEVPGTSLVSLVQLLADAGYRRSIVNRLRDPVVRAFWLHEFAGLPAKLQAEAIAPIQNKVGQFVANPLLRHILGQSRSTLHLRQIMDRSQVLIVNLSKGRMGDDASSLLGSLLIASLQLAAMSRADVREDQRPDYYLVVDEFQHFATESFANILSEARKYRLALTLAHQYLGQLDEATAAAVFGNAGSLISFAVGATDAEVLAAQLGAPVTAADLQSLPKYTAYARLLIDGLTTPPFSLRTLPPTYAIDPLRSDRIRRRSHRRYTRHVEDVSAEVSQGFAGVAGDNAR